MAADENDGYGQILNSEAQCRSAVPHRVRAMGETMPSSALLDLLRDPFCHPLPVIRVDVLAEDTVEDIRLDLGYVGELGDDAKRSRLDMAA